MRFYVNVDHVATVREARRTDEPDPVRAAMLVELAGADGITVHLREDRRHVSERDVRVLLETVRTGLNLELAAATDVLDIACELRPMQATLVPESREEVTTEGGLALGEPGVWAVTGEAVERLSAAGIRTSLFVDPDERPSRSQRISASRPLSFTRGSTPTPQTPRSATLNWLGSVPRPKPPSVWVWLFTRATVSPMRM